jgi:GTPase SAR1 family protein
VQEKWIPRIRYYMGDRMPIVLVATQTDLRDNQIVNCQLSNGGLKSVSRAQGHALAKRIVIDKCTDIIINELKRSYCIANHCLYFFIWSLCGLSFFDLQIRLTFGIVKLF